MACHALGMAVRVYGQPDQATTFDVKAQLIRRRYAAGGLTQRQLGRWFGVSQTHVGDILTGRRWPQQPCSR